MEPIKTLMTERVEAPTDETVLTTPSGYPDVQIVSMTELNQAFVRGTRTFIQTLAVTFAAIMTGAPQAATVEALRFFDLPVPQHKALIAILSLVLIPLSTGIAAFIQNYAELKARTDVTLPKMRA